MSVDLNVKENKFYKDVDTHELPLRYEINK